ncbi:hypothetical protein JKF63_06620 [Porcisia hertigi]|uniref:Uncharacterized protein n=1 Tax=Porcisia hertigi TaxID=2761500 RepID=A0A836IVH0_9TRYP|nr:hypothetical protein JKF63_06620 [Porcisia hertigi]
MMPAESADCNGVPLPASMQTLLDRYTDRKLTPQERLVLAHATPNVRCEALRVFFEMNDAAAGVEYVLANGGASPRSHGGTSAGASLSGSSATTFASAAPVATVSSTSKSVSVSTPTPSKTGARQKTAAAFGRKGHFSSSSLTANAAVGRRASKSPSISRIVVPTSSHVSPSRKSKARSCSRTAGAAWRGESVCTFVTVSSMSSECSGDEENAGQSIEPAAREKGMPPTRTTRSHRAPSNATASGTALVPALALESVLKPNGGNAISSTGFSIVDVSHGGRRLSPSVAMTSTTPLAVHTQPRGLSPSIAPLLGVECLSGTTAEPNTMATADAPVSMPVAPPPLAPANHEDSGDDEVSRKTVAAKPRGYYTDPTASLTTPAPHPQEKHRIQCTHSSTVAMLDAYQRDRTPTLSGQSGAGSAYTELSSSHMNTTLSSPPPWVTGAGGTASMCSTDWPALIAAARPPQAPTSPVVATNKPVTALPASLREDSRLAPEKTADTTPLSSYRSTCPPTTQASPKRSQKTRDREPGDAAAAISSSGFADKTQQLLRTPRRYFEDNVRKSGENGKRSSRKAPNSLSGSSQASPLPPSSQSCGVSPIKRGVAWNEATGTYITHPNQLRRQMTPGGAPAAEVRSARTSAPEIPDTLHYCFVRTPSRVMTGDDVTAAHVSVPPTRIPTATTGAHVPSPDPLARLCSSAGHLGAGGDVRCTPSLAAALPSTKHLKKSKRKSEVKGLETPARVQARKKPTKVESVAATPGPPPRVAPIGASTRSAGYHRLRSDYVSPKLDVFEHRAEAMALHRRASQHPSPVLATAVGCSPNMLCRTPSCNRKLQSARESAPATRIADHYTMMSKGGADMADTGRNQAPTRVHCSSNIRTPRTPRSARFPSQQQQHRMYMVPVAGMTTPRRGAADCTHQEYRNAALPGTGPVPSAQCSVFERLASNYYSIYTSAAALHANPQLPVPASPRVGRSGRERPQLTRRRHLSAPAASVRARHPRRHATPKAVREVYPDSGVTNKGSEKRITAPSPFSRSRTPRYHIF